MKQFLSKSVKNTYNRNKLIGLRAEIELRNTLNDMGFKNRISAGGWISRSTENNNFGHKTVVVFPQTITPGISYSPDRLLEEPPRGLHTICATMHQLGIFSYHCVPTIAVQNDYYSIKWDATQLGVPFSDTYHEFPQILSGFMPRRRRHNFLNNNADISLIPDAAIPDLFSKEHLRVNLQNKLMTETVDIDGIFWGERYTYPIEIKEKTPANDPRLGKYFGLDIGPFVKLAFYAAKKGNLHSLFIVREINNTEERNLVNWWFITFDKLAQYASWNFQGGGKNMEGGRSAVVKIPMAEFTRMDEVSLKCL